MAEAADIHLVSTVKRVGNSLAFFIPAEAARAAGIREGMSVEADLRPAIPKVFGALRDLPYEPFERDDLWEE